MSKKTLLIVSLILLLCSYLLLSVQSFAQSRQSHSILVNGEVIPTTNDYSISITSDKATQTIPQGTLITYTLTYGGHNNSAYTTNTTITANYSDDTPDSVTHVTDYVVGSATDAVNSTTPVVDPINRTITWNITNFNSQLINQTVQFQLITNSNYTVANPVNINTTMELTNTFVTMPVVTTTTTYLYNSNLTPTPTNTPTPIPTATPSLTPTSIPGHTSIVPTNTPAPTTPTPTPSVIPVTPSPTPVPPREGILTVEVTNLQPTLAQLLIQTTKTDSLIINYGLVLTNLDKNMHFPAHGIDTPTLQPLQPDTTYYIQISALNKNGQVINRDTFVIHTPASGSLPAINLSSLLLNADGININKNNFALSGTMPEQSYLLPTSNDYSLLFSYSYAKNISLVSTIVRRIDQNTNTSLPISPDAYQTRMYERSPNSYVASLTSQPTEGIYAIYIKSTTTNGFIVEQQVATLHILKPLHVYDSDNISPLTDARAYIEFYDFTKHTYMPLQTLYPQIKNPLFTRSDGTLYFPFPAGKYKVTISAFGHEEKTIYFPIGLTDNQQLPQVNLHADYWNISYFFRFIRETVTDFISTLSTEIYLIGSRQSYFILLAIVLMPITVSFLAFFAKTHMTPRTLVHFLRRHVKKGVIYRFSLVDEDTKAISDAEIYLVNALDIVIFDSKTNALGVSYAQIPDFNGLSVRILKQGYEPLEEKISTFEVENQTITIKLSKKPLHQHTKIVLFAYLLKEFFGTLFEAFLLFSLISEVLFAFQFGILHTAPFLILSLINIVFWISYMQEKSSNL